MSKDSALTNLKLNPFDANVMVRFVGELNENLKFVEKTYNVKIFQNGDSLKIKGSKKMQNCLLMRLLDYMKPQVRVLKLQKKHFIYALKNQVIKISHKLLL